MTSIPSRGATGDTDQAVSQSADASASGAAHGGDEAGGKLPSRERAAEHAEELREHIAQVRLKLAGGTVRHRAAVETYAASMDMLAAIFRAYASGALVPVERVAEIDRLRAVLEWYAEQARLCRLITSEGDAGRNALDEDGGKRARAALDGEGKP